jgi:hypothetical protein
VKLLSLYQGKKISSASDIKGVISTVLDLYISNYLEQETSGVTDTMKTIQAL